MFLVDTMCGRLAKWLRILGYDTEWVSDKERAFLISRCLKESRILITRDIRFKNSRGIKKVILQSNDISGQIKQCVQDLHIAVKPEQFFKRCSFCNRAVEETDKRKIMTQVPSYVYEVHQKFYQCPECKRIYWDGTHKKLFETQISAMLKDKRLDN